MPDRDRLLRIYETMRKIRSFEEAAVALFERNKLRGSVHLYIGEEAVAASVCSALTDKDYITSTHRGHGHAIAKGAELSKAMAELMGKAAGYCKGRGGSMHIADFEKGNLGANAIVGGGIPIAVGGGLAEKLKGTQNISVSFFGDGASNQGTFHESLNLASVWKLPVIFICENNGFAISVPVEQSTSVGDIAVRAGGYDMPGVTVDGNDVLAICDAVDAAAARARGGGGPTLIECRTYRWKGHWIGDPEVYRTKADIAAWMEKCPINRLREYLIEKKMSSAGELDAIEAGVQKAVDEAVRFAEDSPDPDPAFVMDDVYCEAGGSNR
ncbi:MAG: thiamine pyrophosphate-dependent dehydrogenase E1 component subunit alpha [Oscillospiraceae bacterium]|jgi:pyruvate dehydrogenase E1 component alpha subunit|nr:thiamine pyrophosphate-dependent dehydrogenase E1 component subunit alpha [Oscillospiraceae bacterium]